MATLQDHLFEPCGYSMNALEGRTYYTIHVSTRTEALQSERGELLRVHMERGDLRHVGMDRFRCPFCPDEQ